jgi:hypothetical protein
MVRQLDYRWNQVYTSLCFMQEKLSALEVTIGIIG